MTTLANANFLIVTVFDTDTGNSTTVELHEDDYTGLIAEYEAGVATTILDTAIDAEFSAPTTGAELSATQESWRASKTLT